MDIDSLINAQFNRAVEIVQSLPKTGPIQTGYEEKLAMYSLYKQATQGNVKTSRPGMWDMLGRAKWDEWAKHKDMDKREAQWMYVETLKKVLRKYPDRVIARDLIAELDSFAGDPNNLVMSSHSNMDTSTSLHDRAETSSSGSSRTQGSPSPMHAALREAQQQGFTHTQRPTDTTVFESSEDDTSESETDGETDNVPPPPPQPQQQAQQSSNSPPIVRPRSSLSSQYRYRTPVARSNATFSPVHSPNAQQGPTPIVAGVPLTQPQPRYAAPSAFAPLAHQASALAFSPQPAHQLHPTYHPHSHMPPPPPEAMVPHQSHPTAYPPETSRSPPHTTSTGLERAIVDIQASLAALRERMEMLEQGGSFTSYSSGSRRQSPPRRHSPLHPTLPFNLDPRSFGAWSVVLTPLARSVISVRKMMEVVRRNPTLIIIRRLMLDISFLLALVALIRACWRRFGGRRKEVLSALSGLWIALVNGGQMPARERILIDRGI